MFWRSEFRNMLAGEIRRGTLDVEKAVEVQALAEELVAIREFAVDSVEVLKLAAASGRSAYDCEFVAIAGRSTFHW